MEIFPRNFIFLIFFSPLVSFANDPSGNPIPNSGGTSPTGPTPGECGSQQLAVVLGMGKQLAQAFSASAPGKLPEWVLTGPSTIGANPARRLLPDQTGSQLPALVETPRSGAESLSRALVALAARGPDPITVNDPRGTVVGILVSNLGNIIDEINGKYVRVAFLKTLFVRHPEWTSKIWPVSFKLDDDLGLNENILNFRAGLRTLYDFVNSLGEKWDFQPNAYGWPQRLIYFNSRKNSDPVEFFPEIAGDALQNKNAVQKNVLLDRAVEQVWIKLLKAAGQGAPLGYSGMGPIVSQELFNFRMHNEISIDDFLMLPQMQELVMAAYYFDTSKSLADFIYKWKGFEDSHAILSSDSSSGSPLRLQMELEKMQKFLSWAQLEAQFTVLYASAPERMAWQSSFLQALSAKSAEGLWMATHVYERLRMLGAVPEFDPNTMGSAAEKVIEYFLLNFPADKLLASSKTQNDFDLVFSPQFFADLAAAKKKNFKTVSIAEQNFISSPNSNDVGKYLSGTHVPEGALAVDGDIESFHTGMRRATEQAPRSSFVEASSKTLVTALKARVLGLSVSKPLKELLEDYVRVSVVLGVVEKFNGEGRLDATASLLSLLKGEVSGLEGFELNSSITREIADSSQLQTFLANKLQALTGKIQQHLGPNSITKTDLDSLLGANFKVNYLEALFENENFISKIPTLDEAKKFILESLDDTSLPPQAVNSLVRALRLEVNSSFDITQKTLRSWLETTPAHRQKELLNFVTYRNYFLQALNL